MHRWDTAGQEKFKCIASAYYRGAEGENNINLILAVTGGYASCRNIYAYVLLEKVPVDKVWWNGLSVIGEKKGLKTSLIVVVSHLQALNVLMMQ